MHVYTLDSVGCPEILLQNDTFHVQNLVLFNIVTKKDVPGELLSGIDLSELHIVELKFWLKCVELTLHRVTEWVILIGHVQLNLCVEQHA